MRCFFNPATRDQKFLLKRHLAMMRFLSLDVIHGFVQLRHAHTERAIFFLPRKKAMFGKGFMNPFCRAALDQLQRFGNRHGRRQRKQYVDVVLHPTDFDGLHFVLPGDAAQKRPEPVAQFRSDEPPSFLGAENAMKIGTDVGLGTHSAVPAGLVVIPSNLAGGLVRRKVPVVVLSFGKENPMALVESNW